ncbi:MAG: 50S ribosomal protein L24 [Candidatus Eremiobacteraeota bacterium]|nr:50S ribosomal protein L24 [Candidatus Eremiobacteraeota bacterium]
MHVRTGDTVQVMRGATDDRGRQGKVLRVFPKTGRVLVEGINIVKKHRRARRPEEQSGILEMPAPIAASKVMLIDPQTGQPTRTRKQTDAEGKKERVAVKSGAVIPAPARDERARA